jgi:MFS family permease
VSPELAVPVDRGDREPARTLFTPAFLLILAMQMSFGFAFSTFFLLPAYLTTVLTAGPDEVGQVTASAMVAAVLAVPAIGRAIDRYDRRRLIIGGALVGAAVALTFVPVQSIGFALFALRAVQGVAFALVFNAAATLVVDLAPAERMGQALGYFGVSALLTNAAAPALGEALARHAGWSPVFVLAAAFSVLCAVFAAFLPKPERRHTRHDVAPDVQDQVRSAKILYAVGVVGVAFGTMFTFSLPFAISLGAREVSGFFAGYTAAAALVRIGLGGVADRIGRQRVALFALLVYGAALFATAELRLEWLMALGALLGIGHGLVYPALNAMSVEGVPTGHRGSRMSLFNGCFNAGVAISTLTLGWVAKHAGYPAVFVVGGVVSLSAVAVLGRRLPPPSTG